MIYANRALHHLAEDLSAQEIATRFNELRTQDLATAAKWLVLHVQRSSTALPTQVLDLAYEMSGYDPDVAKAIFNAPGQLTTYRSDTRLAFARKFPTTARALGFENIQKA